MYQNQETTENVRLQHYIGNQFLVLKNERFLIVDFFNDQIVHQFDESVKAVSIGVFENLLVYTRKHFMVNTYDDYYQHRLYEYKNQTRRLLFDFHHLKLFSTIKMDYVVQISTDSFIIYFNQNLKKSQIYLLHNNFLYGRKIFDFDLPHYSFNASNGIYCVKSIDYYYNWKIYSFEDKNFLPRNISVEFVFTYLKDLKNGKILLRKNGEEVIYYNLNDGTEIKRSFDQLDENGCYGGTLIILSNGWIISHNQ